MFAVVEAAPKPRLPAPLGYHRPKRPSFDNGSPHRAMAPSPEPGCCGCRFWCTCSLFNHHSFLRRLVVFCVPRSPLAHPLRFLMQLVLLVCLGAFVLSLFMFVYYPNDVLKEKARQSCLIAPEPGDQGWPRRHGGGGVICSFEKHSAAGALSARRTVEQVLGSIGAWDSSDAPGPAPTDAEAHREGAKPEDLPPLITAAPPKPELSRDSMKICILSMDTYGVKGMGGTATAYWLMATTLANHRESSGLHPFRVRWITTVLSRNACRRLRTLYALHRVELVCVDPSLGGSRATVQSSHSGRWSFALTSISHGSAVVDWLRRSSSSYMTDFRGRECDLVHSHEWGGVAAPLLMARDDPTITKVLPEFVAVQPHGSHVWSSMARNHTDLYSLGVDFAEKYSMEHADAVISPTAYMLRYAKERGWNSRNPSVIPNIVDVSNHSVPELPSLQPGEVRKSRHLIFFSRIEERKGLGVFAEALHLLAARGGDAIDLKVDFVGKFGTINEHPEQGTVNLTDASVYIREQVQRWPKRWQIRTLNNLTRSEAMNHLKELRLHDAVVVIPSLVENLPYVIAECATLRMRTVAFDTGGIAEMIKPGTGSLILEKSPRALGEQLWKVVGENDMSAAKVPELSDALTAAEKTWIGWHRKVWLSNELPSEDPEKPIRPFSVALKELARKQGDVDPEDYRIAVVDPLAYPNATHMRNVLCEGEGLGVSAITSSDFGAAGTQLSAGSKPLRRRGLDEPDGYLFLTPRYKFIGGRDAELKVLTRALFGGPSNLVALTAGIRRGRSALDPSALATGPLYYARMEDERCFHDYPVVAKRKTFCDFYRVDKKNASEPDPFWTYRAFVLMMKLEESGGAVGTLPLRMFELTDPAKEPVVDGCFEDSDPVLDMAALKNQSLLTLRSSAVHNRVRDHLAPPIVKTVYTWVDTAWSNFTPAQTQPEAQGWFYLYRELDKDGLTMRGEPKELAWWRDDPDRGKEPGTWACPHPTGRGYKASKKAEIGGQPRMHQLWLVPCSNGKPCCGPAPANSAMVRWISNMTIKELNVRAEFELWGSCGDGVRIELRIVRRTLDNSTHAEIGRNVTVLDTLDYGREEGTGKVTGARPSPFQQMYDERVAGSLGVGDYVEAEFFPKKNQDCDSMYYRVEVKEKQRLGYFSYAA
ncbi:hypothetical protein DFJ74DRAFT_750916 [Hyaloraphidium curvatum]|nr:hypothetical protein DFJ74DRAFT_750916 [Hyaloraphidium curvatum]